MIFTIRRTKSLFTLIFPAVFFYISSIADFNRSSVDGRNYAPQGVMDDSAAAENNTN